MDTNNNSRKLRIAIAATLSLATITTGTALAGGPITVVNTSTAVATTSQYVASDTETYNWGEENNLVIDGFVFGGATFEYKTVADNVVLRREDNGNASGELCSLFAETTGTTRHYKATYPEVSGGGGNCDMAAVLSGRVLNRGALDLFSNFGETAKNVERADFIFTGGITASQNAALLDTSGHIVTEKNGNNPIKIAAILSLDGAGVPNQFGKLLTVYDNAFLPGVDVEYGLTGITATNDFMSNTSANPDYPVYIDTQTETLGMAFVSLTDLEITAGQTYFGFAYFANDVPDTADLTLPATFPKDTGNAITGDEADLYGGTAGYFTLASMKTISGKIFQDDDANGSQNGAETGIPAVSVAVFEDTDTNGTYTDGTDQQVGVSVVTDNDGAYTLTVETAGDYFVLVDDNDTDIPVNLTLSPANNPAKVTVAALDINGQDFPLTQPVGAEDPVANNDPASTVQGTPVDISVIGNDTPIGGVFTLTIDTDPTNGGVSITGDVITYTPNGGFSGVDTFIYQIEDANGKLDTATVTVTVTAVADFDNDGIADSVDIDDDNDGILDTVEGITDFDGDGQPNHHDLDADGDGISDLEESGLIESTQTALDSNNDGEIDSTQAFGANGLADNVEISPESAQPDYAGDGTVTTPVDTDVDNHPDFLDLDTDNDGIFDVIEAGLVDTDGNGEADTGQAPTNFPVDTDGDVIADYRDLDSDNDGLTDITEASGVDSDNDGRVDNFNDPNNDGYDDALVATPLLLPDTDGDSIADFRDLDSDNDGLTDIIEGGGKEIDQDAKDGRVDNFVDENGDGRHDPLATSPLLVPDTDEDEIADFRDLDSDNDGISDLIEASGTDTDTDGNGRIDNFTDSDNDGYDDNIATSPLPAPDTDADSHPDYLDLDSDNDGISDLIEAGGVDTDFNGVVDNFTDANGDGMDDPLNTATAGTALPVPDTDEDGKPDYRDLDSDGDSMLDIMEAGLPDADNDGLIDGFVDTNNDGIDDNIQAVLAGGGLKDADNNGVADFREVCECGDEAIFRTGLEGNGGGSMGLGMLGLLGAAMFRRRRKATSLTSVSVVALMATLPLSAQAENSPSSRNFDSRIYIGAGIGATKLEPEAACPCYEVNDDSSEGSEIFLGVDVSRSITLEGYYADLGSAGVRRVTGEDASEVDYQVYGISAIGYLLNSRDGGDYKSGYDDEGKFRREGLSLYGRVGVGAMENDAVVKYERVEDVHLHLGIGAEYGWENGIAARAEYTSYDEDAQLLSLALLKRFGQVEEVNQSDNDTQPEAKATPIVAPKVARAPVNNDSDNDGVPNHKDICSETKKGVRVNNVGCTIDRDKDGVVNEADRCPHTPVGIRVDENGCQEMPLGHGFTGIFQGVNFHTDSDRLTEKAKETLDDAAIELNRFPKIGVVIVGHTDNQGTTVSNKDLSVRRAKAVARYLVGKSVIAKRLRYAGKGESQPIASNNTSEGRALNRRVEFVIQ